MTHPVMSHTTIDTDSATITQTHIWLTMGLWTVYVDVSNAANEPHPIVQAWLEQPDSPVLQLTGTGGFRVWN